MTTLLNWILLFLLLFRFQVPYPQTFTSVDNGSNLQEAYSNGYEVRVHPDGDLHTGDLISFEIFSPPGVDLQNSQISVNLFYPVQEKLGSAEFYSQANGQYRAVLRWVWNTQNDNSGFYYLNFTVLPGGVSWQEIIQLKQAPADGNTPHWESITTDCCTVHYITGTPAERDIGKLIPIIDAQAQDVEKKLGKSLPDDVNITLLPRLLGQGGFADDEIYIAYPERNYSNIDFSFVLRHEMVHRVDQELGGDLRPTILVEGFAVYITGGHFKPEPLLPRASALLDMGLYIPLDELADNFYPSQHETGYIEAGALVEYLVNTYGYDRFSEFYRHIHPVSSGSQAEAIDRALRKTFDITFKQLEDNLIDYLRLHPADHNTRMDVALTIEYYDTIRQYQQLLDPSAYYQTVWLPPAKEMREKNIVADYLYHPNQPENRVIETMLEAAGRSIGTGDGETAEGTLAEVKYLLSQFPVKTALQAVPVETGTIK